MSLKQTIADLVHKFRYYTDHLQDLRYGGRFGGIIKTRYAHLGAKHTQSSNYYVISSVFAYAPLKAGDVFVDVGCGKGRWRLLSLTNRKQAYIFNLILIINTFSNTMEHDFKNR